ncbi:MAG: hypothetical protein RXO43_01595 [Candidatus Micrarchaeota archaeon]
MKNDEIIKIADMLQKEPNETNWEKFAKALKKSGIKYYRIVYVSLKNAEDLTRSYAELFDAKGKLVTKVPIFKRGKGKKVEGATIYLKGLLNINKW